MFQKMTPKSKGNPLIYYPGFSEYNPHFDYSVLPLASKLNEVNSLSLLHH